ncbi:hypothetical protein SLS62_002112 [Diatrype stigma]|uniref:Six-bladed beta-propeller-like protein n=1 Tax=Diatrype stigma TaxID=117547 RepID=A0AAN9UZ72_9PEZI
MRLAVLASALMAVAAAAASPASLPASRYSDNSNNNTTQPLPHKTIFQFNETGTFFENLAVRRNGDLVLTVFHPAPASLWTLRAPYSAGPRMTRVHTFEDAEALSGIAETSPDTFVVATANFTTWPAAAPGSATLREVRLDAADTPRTIARIPEAGLLNGLVAIPGATVTAVLAADVQYGVVYRVDVATGAYEVVVDAPETKAAGGGSALQSNLGVNGLKIRGGYLYWSNTSRATLYRIRIDARGYPVPGAAVETVGTIRGATALDDFTFGPGPEGDIIWAATGFDNMLATVRVEDGTSSIVLGSPAELTLGGDTAAAFGGTALDREILYVITDGASAAPVNGTMEPAKIVAVDTRGYRRF